MTDEEIRKLADEYAEWELNVLPAGLKKLTTEADKLQYSTPAYHAFSWLFNKLKNNIKYEISISKLTKTFPDFIWMQKVLELCGWNPETHQWIVIDDGMCISEDGTWVVHMYQFPPSDDPIKTHYKYGHGEKLIEERYKLIWE